MPLLTDTKSTTGYLAGGAAGSNIVFPKDSIIPYYSTTPVPSISGWSLYGTGGTKYICGTTTPSLVSTTTADTDATISVTLGTAGAHTGTVTYISSGGYSTGSTINDSTNNSAGSHAHSSSISLTGSYKLSPSSYNVTLLRATSDVGSIPANTIAFRPATSGSYGTRLNPSGTNYLYHNAGASGTTNSGTTSVTAYGGTSQSGAHFHHQNIMQYYITGKLTNYWGLSAGAHVHNISATYSQSVMNSTIILDAWFSSTARIALTDVMVMYAGDPGLLPSGWYICNGNNGTLNMSGVYASIAPNTGSWGTRISANGSVSGVTVGDIGSHSHVSNYSPAGAGRVLYHNTQSWPHTHTVTSGSIPYELGKLYLYFIQYKG